MAELFKDEQANISKVQADAGKVENKDTKDKKSELLEQVLVEKHQIFFDNVNQTRDFFTKAKSLTDKDAKGVMDKDEKEISELLLSVGKSGEAILSKSDVEKNYNVIEKAASRLSTATEAVQKHQKFFAEVESANAARDKALVPFLASLEKNQEEIMGKPNPNHNHEKYLNDIKGVLTSLGDSEMGKFSIKYASGFPNAELKSVGDYYINRHRDLVLTWTDIYLSKGSVVDKATLEAFPALELVLTIRNNPNSYPKLKSLRDSVSWQINEVNTTPDLKPAELTKKRGRISDDLKKAEPIINHLNFVFGEIIKKGDVMPPEFKAYFDVMISDVAYMEKAAKSAGTGVEVGANDGKQVMEQIEKDYNAGEPSPKQIGIEAQKDITALTTAPDFKKKLTSDAYIFDNSARRKMDPNNTPLNEGVINDEKLQISSEKALTSLLPLKGKLSKVDRTSLSGPEQAQLDAFTAEINKQITEISQIKLVLAQYHLAAKLCQMDGQTGVGAGSPPVYFKFTQQIVDGQEVQVIEYTDRFKSLPKEKQDQMKAQFDALPKILAVEMLMKVKSPEDKNWNEGCQAMESGNWQKAKGLLFEYYQKNNGNPEKKLQMDTTRGILRGILMKEYIDTKDRLYQITNEKSFHGGDAKAKLKIEGAWRQIAMIDIAVTTEKYITMEQIWDEMSKAGVKLNVGTDKEQGLDLTNPWAQQQLLSEPDPIKRKDNIRLLAKACKDAGLPTLAKQYYEMYFNEELNKSQNSFEGKLRVKNALADYDAVDHSKEIDAAMKSGHEQSRARFLTELNKRFPNETIGKADMQNLTMTASEKQKIIDKWDRDYEGGDKERIRADIIKGAREDIAKSAGKRQLHEEMQKHFSYDDPNPNTPVGVWKEAYGGRVGLVENINNDFWRTEKGAAELFVTWTLKIEATVIATLVGLYAGSMAVAAGGSVGLSSSAAGLVGFFVDGAAMHTTSTLLMEGPEGFKDPKTFGHGLMMTYATMGVMKGSGSLIGKVASSSGKVGKAISGIAESESILAKTATLGGKYILKPLVDAGIMTGVSALETLAAGKKLSAAEMKNQFGDAFVTCAIMGAGHSIAEGKHHTAGEARFRGHGEVFETNKLAEKATIDAEVAKAKAKAASDKGKPDAKLDAAAAKAVAKAEAARIKADKVELKADQALLNPSGQEVPKASAEKSKTKATPESEPVVEGPEISATPLSKKASKELRKAAAAEETATARKEHFDSLLAQEKALTEKKAAYDKNPTKSPAEESAMAAEGTKLKAAQEKLVKQLEAQIAKEPADSPKLAELKSRKALLDIEAGRITAETKAIGTDTLQAQLGLTPEKAMALADRRNESIRKQILEEFPGDKLATEKARLKAEKEAAPDKATKDRIDAQLDSIIAKESLLELYKKPGDYETYTDKGIRDIAKIFAKEGIVIEMYDMLDIARKKAAGSGKEMTPELAAKLMDMESTLGKPIVDKATGTPEKYTEALKESASLLTQQKGIRAELRGIDPKDPAKIAEALGKTKNAADRLILEKAWEDLNGIQAVNGKDALTPSERQVIMDYSVGFLAQFRAASAASGKAFNINEVFELVRDNQRKIAHQSAFDKLKLVGSDHGAVHLLDGNMKLAEKAMEDLKMSPQDRVLAMQALIDHDMGYTMEGIRGKTAGTNLFSFSADHPINSTLYVEGQRAKYEKYFGKEGYQIIHDAVLDHSAVVNSGNSKIDALGKPLSSTKINGPAIKAIVSMVDCLGTTANVKSSTIFMHQEIMGSMQKLRHLQDNPPKKNAEGKDLSPAEQKAALKAEAQLIIDEMIRMAADMPGVDPATKKIFADSIRESLSAGNFAFPVDGNMSMYGAAMRGIEVVGGKLAVNLSFDPLMQSTLVESYADKKTGQSVSVKAVEKALGDFGFDKKACKTPQELAAFDVAKAQLDKLAKGEFPPGSTVEIITPKGIKFNIKIEAIPEYAPVRETLSRNNSLNKLRTEGMAQIEAATRGNYIENGVEKPASKEQIAASIDAGITDAIAKYEKLDITLLDGRKASTALLEIKSQIKKYKSGEIATLDVAGIRATIDAIFKRGGELSADVASARMDKPFLEKQKLEKRAESMRTELETGGVKKASDVKDLKLEPDGTLKINGKTSTIKSTEIDNLPVEMRAKFQEKLAQIKIEAIRLENVSILKSTPAELRSRSKALGDKIAAYGEGPENYNKVPYELKCEKALVDLALGKVSKEVFSIGADSIGKIRQLDIDQITQLSQKRIELATVELNHLETALEKAKTSDGKHDIEEKLKVARDVIKAEINRKVTELEVQQKALKDSGAPPDPILEKKLAEAKAAAREKFIDMNEKLRLPRAVIRETEAAGRLEDSKTEIAKATETLAKLKAEKVASEKAGKTDKSLDQNIKDHEAVVDMAKKSGEIVKAGLEAAKAETVLEKALQSKDPKKIAEAQSKTAETRKAMADLTEAWGKDPKLPEQIKDMINMSIRERTLASDAQGRIEKLTAEAKISRDSEIASLDKNDPKRKKLESIRDTEASLAKLDAEITKKANMDSSKDPTFDPISGDQFSWGQKNAKELTAQFEIRDKLLQKLKDSRTPPPTEAETVRIREIETQIAIREAHVKAQYRIQEQLGSARNAKLFALHMEASKIDVPNPSPPPTSIKLMSPPDVITPTELSRYMVDKAGQSMMYMPGDIAWTATVNVPYSVVAQYVKTRPELYAALKLARKNGGGAGIVGSSLGFHPQAEDGYRSKDIGDGIDATPRYAGIFNNTEANWVVPEVQGKPMLIGGIGPMGMPTGDPMTLIKIALNRVGMSGPGGRTQTWLGTSEWSGTSPTLLSSTGAKGDIFPIRDAKTQVFGDDHVVRKGIDTWVRSRDALQSKESVFSKESLDIMKNIGEASDLLTSEGIIYPEYKGVNGNSKKGWLVTSLEYGPPPPPTPTYKPPIRVPGGSTDTPAYRTEIRAEIDSKIKLVTKLYNKLRLEVQASSATDSPEISGTKSKDLAILRKNIMEMEIAYSKLPK